MKLLEDDCNSVEEFRKNNNSTVYSLKRWGAILDDTYLKYTSYKRPKRCQDGRLNYYLITINGLNFRIGLEWGCGYCID